MAGERELNRQVPRAAAATAPPSLCRIVDGTASAFEMSIRASSCDTGVASLRSLSELRLRRYLARASYTDGGIRQGAGGYLERGQPLRSG